MKSDLFCEKKVDAVFTTQGEISVWQTAVGARLVLVLMICVRLIRSSFAVPRTEWRTFQCIVERPSATGQYSVADIKLANVHSFVSHGPFHVK